MSECNVVSKALLDIARPARFVHTHMYSMYTPTHMYMDTVSVYMAVYILA